MIGADRKYKQYEWPNGAYLARDPQNLQRAIENMESVNSTNSIKYARLAEQHRSLLKASESFYGLKHPITESIRRAKPRAPLLYDVADLHRLVQLFNKREAKRQAAEERANRSRARHRDYYRRSHDEATQLLREHGFVEGQDFTYSNSPQKVKNLLVKVGEVWSRKV